MGDDSFYKHQLTNAAKWMAVNIVSLGIISVLQFFCSKEEVTEQQLVYDKQFSLLFLTSLSSIVKVCLCLNVLNLEPKDKQNDFKTVCRRILFSLGRLGSLLMIFNYSYLFFSQTTILFELNNLWSNLKCLNHVIATLSKSLLLVLIAYLSICLLLMIHSFYTFISNNQQASGSSNVVWLLIQ